MQGVILLLEQTLSGGSGHHKNSDFVATHGRKLFPSAVGTTQNTRKKEHEQRENTYLLFLELQKCRYNPRKC